MKSEVGGERVRGLPEHTFMLHLYLRRGYDLLCKTGWQERRFGVKETE